MSAKRHLTRAFICIAAALLVAASSHADAPPPPDLLFYDMDFNNNGQRDDGDLALLCLYYMDFRTRGHLTEVTNRANVYHDDKLDHKDIELLIDDWLDPKYHPFLTPAPWPPGSSQVTAAPQQHKTVLLPIGLASRRAIVRARGGFRLAAARP